MVVVVPWVVTSRSGGPSEAGASRGWRALLVLVVWWWRASVVVGAKRAVIGFDVGTESVRAGLFDASDGRLVALASRAHGTTYPAAGSAEQRPADWWAGVGAACRALLPRDDAAEWEVVALCVATTSCTVVACGADGEPLRDAILWCDQRSADEAAAMVRVARGDPALRVNSGGAGPVSAEWFLPKALWLQRHEPDVFARVATLCECQDYLNFKLTGVWCASGCTVATRWHCDGAAAVSSEKVDGVFGGRPTTLLDKVGLSVALHEKWPRACVAVGGLVGGLTPEAAAHLGLPRGTPVAQGGADAFVGLIGLGITGAGDGVGVITGSSTLHLAVAAADDATAAHGKWGAYRGAPLPHLSMSEGGQSTTGASLAWARRLMTAPVAQTDGDSKEEAEAETEAEAASSFFADLDREAAALPIGAEGCSALETLQGSRTPTTDPLARGALFGLTLKHGRAHVWRALLEATCLGTRASVDALEEQGTPSHEAEKAPLRLAGGATRSDLWLQMHADACGRVVIVGESAEAPLLGCAVLAATLAGDHPTIAAAARAMVRVKRVVEPDPAAMRAFDDLYDAVYSHAAPALRTLSHRTLRKATTVTAPQQQQQQQQQALIATPSHQRKTRRGVVSASLLGADPLSLGAAAVAAINAGTAWLHVDVFDGGAACAGALSGLGPSTVAALHRAAPRAYLDVHLAAADVEAHLGALARAGAHRITFQAECCADDAARRRVARRIRALGLDAGVCLAPQTPLTVAALLVDEGLVDLVDVLAVPPGRGGQAFDPAALDRIRHLRARHPDLPYLQVDGGIDATTAKLAVAAGANVLVAGSFVFQKSPSPAAAVQALNDALDLPPLPPSA